MRLIEDRFATRYITGDDDIKKSSIMFAGEKLLCKPFSSSDDFVRSLTDDEKMACMSVRIPLEFNARTLRSQEREMILVEKHMRVCLSVDAGFETAVTVAPSEPILAEASYLVMRNPAFDLPRHLLAELERPGLDKGSRGEVIVATLCLEARDAAATMLQSRIIPVNDFITHLIAPRALEEVLLSKPIMVRTSDEADRTLEDTFRTSHMYFNHFVKFRGRQVINRTYLLGLIARGAAGICADFQYGVDIIIPFLYRDTVLRPENVSALFFQSKNDETFQGKPAEYLFDMMNPCQTGFFNVREKSPVPVIRMVFALASRTACVIAVKHGEKMQAPRADGFKAKFQADKYTAFDIWCGKASQETFRPIEDDNVYQKLLLRSRVFPDVYERKKSKAIEIATRSMNPGTDVHAAHWEHFYDPHCVFLFGLILVGTNEGIC
jgi:hypothetical protein